MTGKRLALISALLLVAAALLVPGVATGNWLATASLLLTGASLTITWTSARRRDRTERDAFAERMERARRPEGE